MHHRASRSASAKRLLLALVLSTSLVPPGVLPTLAGALSRIEPPPAVVAMPGSEAGALRTWVQLVWNPATRQLERLALSAWDPIPSRNLELTWLPDDPAAYRAGLIDGRGTLTFRRPGAPAYDPSAVVAQYRGMLAAGRADGTGEFLGDGGFAYSGAWRAGLMEGQGRLTLANGDEYVGAFRAGLWDGDGVFTDATGRVYRGHFTNGEPDAQGVLAQAEAGLRVGVVTERRPHNYALGIDPLSYTSKSDGERLDILPDDQRLLDVWHGAVPITMTDDEVSAFDDASTTPSFLGNRERFDPVSIVFEIENSTTDTVTVVGGYLDVAESARSKEPAMQVRPYPRDPCSGAVDFLPRFFVDNFGWASADNAALNFSAAALDGRSEGTALTAPLGSIADSVEANVTEQLTGLGLDTDYVATNKLVCTDPTDDRLCLAELRQSGHFGKLGDFLSLDYTTVEIQVQGTLDYDWTASDGTVAHKTSPFAVVIPIASVASDAECGEGGEIIPVSHDPFQLHLDEKGYRIAIPFSGDITPGFTTRWRIELSAPETSDHDFTLVLLLSDGSQIVSRPIHLTYFMPPKHAVAQP